MELHLEPLRLPGIDPKRPVVVAGPCSAETEEQVMTTATQLCKKGIKIFRAGIWKPRTKPGGFEGVGTVGLPWMQRVQQELGMLVATEVATPRHVEAALEAGIDLLWVGARTVANPFAMQELADSLRGADVLDFILDKLVIREATQSTESLETLRRQIDECDNSILELLARRMRVSREIGLYKREHNMTVVQASRYSEILEKRGAQGVLCGMSAEFMKAVFEAIHEESVRQQIEIMNKE